MVEWVESSRVSLSDTPVEVAVRVKVGLVVKQVPRGEKIGVLLNIVPHLKVRDCCCIVFYFMTILFWPLCHVRLKRLVPDEEDELVTVHG